MLSNDIGINSSNYASVKSFFINEKTCKYYDNAIYTVIMDPNNKKYIGTYEFLHANLNEWSDRKDMFLFNPELVVKLIDVAGGFYTSQTTTRVFDHLKEDMIYLVSRAKDSFNERKAS